MQGYVCMKTKEADIAVNYGMINLRPEREDARHSLKYIFMDMEDIRKSFIRFGFHLYEFERSRYYEDFGYTTLAEFAEANLGLSKSQVSIYKNIYLEFGARDSLYSTPKMWLDDKYKDYSYSQLREMLPLNKQQRNQVTTDMTIDQIRQLKKKVATSQPEEKAPKKRFSRDDYMQKKGAVANSYVKSCDPVYNTLLFFYNENGEPLKTLTIDSVINVWLDVLENKNGIISIRIRSKEK